MKPFPCNFRLLFGPYLSSRGCDTLHKPVFMFSPSCERWEFCSYIVCDLCYCVLFLMYKIDECCGLYAALVEYSTITSDGILPLVWNHKWKLPTGGTPVKKTPRWKKALEILFKQKCALEFFDVLAAMLLCFLACDNLALNWFANYPNTAKVCAVRSGCSHVRATPLSCCKNLLSLLKNKQTRSCLSTQQIQMMMITFLMHALTKQK